MSGKPDDLEAVRKIVDALGPFEAQDQERIIRWSREKLGLVVAAGSPVPPLASPSAAGRAPTPQPGGMSGQQRDLRAFVAAKAPSSDVQFATTVAYYYRFEAQESERKESVTADDLLDACRKAGRNRLQDPGQTIRNAHRDGLLDRANRGAFSINAVGENLVAMTLPAGSRSPAQGRPRRSATKETKKKVAKRGSRKR